MARTRPGELFSEGNARYLGWLTVFSLLSELPYRLLSPESATLNVMPTLLLGLLVAWGVHDGERSGLLLAAATVLIATLLHQQMMYGVLLPAAFVQGLKGLRWRWLPAALAVLANGRNRWFAELGLVADTLTAFAMACAAALLGLYLLHRTLPLKVWPVGRWGYLFYPGHLVALHVLRSMAL